MEIRGCENIPNAPLAQKEGAKSLFIKRRGSLESATWTILF